jgi:hypothetical protein
MPRKFDIDKRDFKEVVDISLVDTTTPLPIGSLVLQSVNGELYFNGTQINNNDDSIWTKVGSTSYYEGNVTVGSSFTLDVSILTVGTSTFFKDETINLLSGSVTGSYVIGDGSMLSNLTVSYPTPDVEILSVDSTIDLSKTASFLKTGHNYTIPNGTTDTETHVLVNTQYRYLEYQWLALDSGLGGPGGDAFSMNYDESSGNLYVGGRFGTASGTRANCIAVWNGSSWSNLTDSTSGTVGFPFDTVYGVAYLDGNLYCGGTMRFFTNNDPIDKFARWNVSTETWTNMPGISVGNFIRKVQPHNSKIYISGSFSSFDGNSCSRIVTYDPSTGIYSNIADTVSGTTGGSDWTFDFTFTDTDDLYICGRFTTFSNGSSANRVARYVNGTTWENIDSGSPIDDFAQAIQYHNGNIYVGGEFTNKVAMYNISSSTWTSTLGGSGLNNDVYAVVEHNNLIYFGGKFSAITGSNAAATGRVVVYDPVTSLLDRVEGEMDYDGPGDSEVDCLELYGPSAFLAGGQFFSVTDLQGGEPPIIVNGITEFTSTSDVPVLISNIITESGETLTLSNLGSRKSILWNGSNWSGLF